ncbi:MAG TPA: glycosyltransferase 87 family protein [Gaiellaceae bacterium]|nr:glycosyltransferase 87 family protein [Gaiellaceae bacterium]
MSDRSQQWTDALVAAGVFLACFGLVHTWFWAHGELVDWPTYERYGSAIVDRHLVPYRDFKVDYPPGALPVFVVPSYFGDYAIAFQWVMAACGVALVGVLAFVRREAAYYAALAPLLVGSLILSRFDLWPALLLVAALGALIAGRDSIGWAFLGAAVAAKLWPLVVVPPALLWSVRRGHGRSAVAGLAVAAIVFVPFAVVAPHGVWDTLSSQGSRPLQIESLGAAFLTTFGHPHVVTTHGSQNLAGHGAFGAALSVVGTVAVIATWIAFARGPATRDRFVRYAVAAVCAFVAFDKVLSPQYLLWLIPLVPLVRGRRGVVASALLTAACVLTQVWFPQRYFAYANDFHLAWVVLLRDLVLVALFAALVTPRRERAQPHTT